MYNEKKFLGIIPARGGSKGISRKNLVSVKGRPLIEYTIDAALNSRYLDNVLVSTDNEEIAEVSKELGASVPFLRPEALASDTSKTIDVLVHAVDYLKGEGEVYDYIVLLQPTQPLRKSSHIDEAIKQLVDNNSQDMISVSEVSDHPLLMRTVANNDSCLVPLLNSNSSVRRQDFPKYYKVNGAIYINEINEKFNKSLSLNDNTTPYFMEGKFDLDIDEPKDLHLLEYMLDKYDS